MPLPRRVRTVPKPLLPFLLLLLVLSTVSAQEFALQTAQLAAIEPSVVLQAHRDVAGDDLSGKDGPLARIGFDLALLYRGFEGGELAAVRVANPLLRVADGRVVVDFVARSSADALLADLEALGLENGVAFGRYVSGRLPIAALADAAALASLNHGRASMAMTSVGLVDSQGDAAMLSDDARATFGVDGSGVTIGTLSDSYNCLAGAATDVANGDLPGGIVVLDEEDGCASGSDEGRGMMQLIADVAPGSDQQFHTAFDGLASFAQGILDLAAAGSDVIVDDVIYFGQAMFQDDIVSQAADQVVAAGVPFFSAAGNSARQSYESAFRGASAGLLPAAISAIDYTPHDFDPGGGVDILQSLTVPNGASVRLALQWDQPYFSISGAPGPANDMDVYLFDAAGTTKLAESIDDNTNGDPFEILSYTNTSGVTETVNVLIAKFNPTGGPDPGLLKYVLFSGNSITFDEYGTSSATSYGHANAAGAASIAAAFFGDTPEFGQTPPLLETFSSGGGVEILFDTSGNPINDLRDKPQFTAPDGTNTTFFGSVINVPDDMDAFPNFFGTSAAAPHAAAVAALMLEANSSLTPDEIYQHLADSAIDMGPVGFDSDSGAGLIQADVAIGAVAAPGTLAFTSSSYSVGEGAGTATITVSRSGGSTGAVTVDLDTADDSATAGSDYTATSTTLNWADGDSADKSATITITDDADDEGDEAVSLSLSNPTGGATLGLSGATLTIVDDDTPATLAFASASVTVDEDAGTATVTVTRSDSSSGPVSVDYQSADGTATAGSDYTAASGTLSWGDGDGANKSFTVAIADDTLVEGDETVVLSLSNPTGNAALGLSGATLTIADVESATLNLALGTNTTSGTVSASPGDEVVVMQVDAVVPAGSVAVSLDGLTVQAALLSTTGVAPQQASLADIVAVNVYLDSDGDGAIDAGETLLGSGSVGAGGVAVIPFTSGADSDVGSAPSLLVSYQIASSISRSVGHGGLALLLAPLGIGLVARLRRRRLALLTLLLALLLTACPAPGPQPPTPRSFSSSVTEVDASAAASGLTVDVTGLPLTGATVRVSP